MTNNNQLSCFLFDLDGTLADTARDLVATLHQLCAEENHPAPDYNNARNIVSEGSAAMIALAFDDNQSKVLQGQLSKRFLDIYSARLCQETRLFAGIEKILNTIESGNLSWGIVTNKPSRFTNPLVKNLGLAKRAACVVSADTTAKSKPHPLPMQHAAALAGVKPEQCIYIGDAATDIEAGKAAGMQTAIAGWGYIAPSENTSLWNADLEFQTPQELMQWL